MTFVKNLFKSNEGAVSIEYVVLLVCIALAALVAFGLLGKATGTIINNTKDMIENQIANATTNANA